MNNIPLKPVLLIDFNVNCFLKLFIKEIAVLVNLILFFFNFQINFKRIKLNNIPLKPVLLIDFNCFLKLFIKEIALLVDLIMND